MRSPGDVVESMIGIGARKLVAGSPCMPSIPLLDVRVDVASVGARQLVLVDVDVDGGDDAEPVAAEGAADAEVVEDARSSTGIVVFIELQQQRVVRFRFQSLAWWCVCGCR